MKKLIMAANIAFLLGISSSASASFFAGNTTYSVNVDEACYGQASSCAPSGNRLGSGSFTITTDATGNAYSVSDYSVTYFSTTGGLTITNALVSGSGFVNESGELDLDFSGREAIFSEFSFLGANPWTINDTTGQYERFSTGEKIVSGSGFSDIAVSGVPLTLLGTTSGIGLWQGVIVSAGVHGSTWSLLGNVPYSEVYNITVQGPISSVPIPGVAWLFGSGLISLACVTHYRKRV